MKNRLILLIFISLFLYSCRSSECKEHKGKRVEAMVIALKNSYSDTIAVREYAEVSIESLIDKYGCECLKKPNLPADQQKELLETIDKENKELIEKLERSRK